MKTLILTAVIFLCNHAYSRSIDASHLYGAVNSYKDATTAETDIYYSFDINDRIVNVKRDSISQEKAAQLKKLVLLSIVSRAPLSVRVLIISNDNLRTNDLNPDGAVELYAPRE